MRLSSWPPAKLPGGPLRSVLRCFSRDVAGPSGVSHRAPSSVGYIKKLERKIVMKEIPKKWIFLVALLAMTSVITTSCSQSDRVSTNISKEADNFNVVRRITALNVRTDKIMFEMIGTLSLKNNAHGELEVIVRTGPSAYKKHFIYLNDWTSYVVEDISGANISPYHYEINFLPEMLLPFTITQTYGNSGFDEE